MRVGKIPLAAVVLVVLFGSRFIANYFFPERSATLEPVFTGIFEIAIVAFLIYYLRLFIKWANNNRKAA